MVLKIAAFVSVGWYTLLLYLGFYYLELDQQLYEKYFQMGWDSYDGLPLSSPENSYFGYWTFSSLASALLLFLLSSPKTPSVLLLIVSNCILLLSYLVLYLLDGDIGINESKIWWITTSIIQLTGHSILMVESSLASSINKSSKQLLLFHALIYIGLIGVGFYYLQWDLELIEEKESLGWQHHDKVMVPEGRAVNVPEMNYHLILLVTTILSLFLHSLILIKNKWSTALRIVLLGLLLYSMVIYYNGYSYTMTESLSWWVGGCSLVAILSVLLAQQLKPAPDLEPIYKDNLLDDLSRLE